MSIESKENLANRLAPVVERVIIKKEVKSESASFAGGMLILENSGKGPLAKIGEQEWPAEQWGFNAYGLASILYELMAQA